MNLIKHLSIKYKLILLVLVVSIVSIVIGFTIIIIKDIYQLRKDLVNKTLLDAALVGEYCVVPLYFDQKDEVADVLKKLRTMPTIENGMVYTEEGELYASYSRSGKKFEPSTPPRVGYHDFKGGYLHVSHSLVYKNEKYGTLYLRASTTLLEQVTGTRIFWLLLVMAGSILLTYILAHRFQRVISQPILKLAGVTEKISQDIDYSIRVQRDEKDEIGTLYRGFNNMLDKIQLWERKRDEAEAEQRRLLGELEAKNKELEQVVYVTSHDLRSPLVNIQGFGQELSYSIKEIESLLNEVDIHPPDTREKLAAILRQDAVESLKFIKSSTTKMDALLSGLLRLSRVGRMSSPFEVLDMDRLLTEVSNALEFHLKEVGADLKVEPLPPCYGSELEINQVFSNLLSNALKYRDPGRPVRIAVSGKTTDEDEQVVYCVEDNGVGIPQEYQKKVFRIFHRLKPDETEGEGLGLAIVHKIVHRHNGKIEVDSRPGEGTRFFITLPASPGQD
jgi:signal transduction histidine kinase